MSKYRFAFYVSDKQRTVMLANALAAGARRHGDRVELVKQEGYSGPLPDFDGAAVLGSTSVMAKRLLRDYKAVNKHCLLFDKGYMARNEYWRVAVDSWQPLQYFQRFFRPPDRLDRLMSRNGFGIEPRRVETDEDRILLAGVCQAHCNFHDLNNANDYHSDVVRTVREHSARDIVYRPNPSWVTNHADEFRPIEDTALSPPQASFSDELKQARLLITHGSSAAFVALAAGVPVMVLGEGIARPMGLTEQDWDKIEEPYWPHERVRHQFFCDVAYCQWTNREYASGEAWDALRLALAGLEPLGGSHYGLLEQYRVMHRSRRYFRGLSTMRLLSPVATLVTKTATRTLLDYGSGKGEQYQEPYFLDKVWGVSVTCYDPAVTGLDKLPDKTFDGVVCIDVLEHVPEQDVPEVLQRIIRYADKFVLLAIATSPAKKVLPDGRNVHVTVRPPVWWDEQIAQARAVSNHRLKVFPLIQVIYESADDERVDN